MGAVPRPFAEPRWNPESLGLWGLSRCWARPMSRSPSASASALASAARARRLWTSNTYPLPHWRADLVLRFGRGGGERGIEKAPRVRVPRRGSHRPSAGATFSSSPAISNATTRLALTADASPARSLSTRSPEAESIFAARTSKTWCACLRAPLSSQASTRSRTASSPTASPCRSIPRAWPSCYAPRAIVPR